MAVLSSMSVKCAPPIATELKLDVIDQLVSAGVKHMEYTSFVMLWLLLRDTT